MSQFVADCLRWVAAFAVMAAAAVAQDAPRRVQQVTFSPPKEVSIRQKSGPSRTFTLISLTEEVATIRTSAGKDVEIEMSRIKLIRTRDGDFDFSPGEEAFASLVRRADRISGVTVETVDVFDPIERFAPGEEIPEDPQPRNPSPGPTTVRNDDPAPVDPDPVRPQPLVMVRPDPATDVEPVTMPTDSGESPVPGGTIYTCATCGRDLPVGVRDGDKCPHCGIVFWNRAPVPASGSPAGTNNTAGYPEATGFPIASGAPDGAAAPATSTTVTTPSGGLNLETVPMWMKVGFFVGLIAIGWLLLQRR